jgi:hypothetical protein
MQMLYIYLFHLMVVIPYFIYIYSQKREITQINKYILLVLGITLLLYHGYKSYQTKYWVYIFHATWLAPFLLYLGLSSKPVYEPLLLFIFAGLGYHLYSLINLLFVK